MASKSFKDKTQQFAKKQFETFAYNQGLQMADETMKSIVKNVQDNFFSKNPNSDILSEANDVTNFGIGSEADIAEIAFDSTTDNSVWLLDKGRDIALTINDFVNGKISKADCTEKLVTTASSFVGKMVKGVTIVTLGIGNFFTLGFLPIPMEWVGHLAGTIASELFCATFKPLINNIRKNEARETYEYLHGFYEVAIEELHRQRELFEKLTAKLFAHRQAMIEECMRNLESAFRVSNCDKISLTLAVIAQEFGGKLKFKNFEEFNDWMLRDEELVI